MRRLLVHRFESSKYSFKQSLSSMIKSSVVIKEWYERLGKVPIYKKGKLPDVDSLLIDGGIELDADVEEINFDELLETYQEKGLITIDSEDLSDEFLQRCKQRYPDIKFLKLDAVTINTNKQFDCIFSNKVLHHFTLDELKKSFVRQKYVIKPNGIFAHSFWIGDKEFTMEGMLFIYHKRKELLNLISKYFTILDTYDYEEFEEGDSIFIVAQNDKFA